MGYLVIKPILTDDIIYYEDEEGAGHDRDAGLQGKEALAEEGKDEGAPPMGRTPDGNRGDRQDRGRCPAR